jgi:lipopolysaccharide transport system ATP-binding protein
MNTVIRVENLSKKYVLRHQSGPRTSYASLREELMNRFFSLVRHQPDETDREEFWALKDVSFEIKQGDAVGIIGRNGAGKSTLLKLLSRITKPTKGRIEIEGHVASLLEVGTGFHQELTGRENIYLNGAILGMERAEIKKRFDEIVAFAEIEKFLDTPVKRYSSGMYMRLAFAVAAHLDPEILIVDEVLAVGDAEFQKKCLGRMEEVSSGGRTVLFVSHNLAAVRALCQKGILLKNGRMERIGPIGEVTDAYAQASTITDETQATVNFPKPAGRMPVRMESATVYGNGKATSILYMGDSLSFSIQFRSDNPIARPGIGYAIRSSQGVDILNANNHYQPSPEYNPPVESGTILCDLGAVPLMPGNYSISLWLCRDQHEQHHLEEAIHFQVEEKDLWGLGRSPPPGSTYFWWPTRFEMKG